MNSADPFLAYTDHDVLDDTGIAGHLDPGETVDLVVDVTNFGPAAEGVLATITTTSPLIDIVDGYAVYGSIGSGETIDNGSNPFVLSASNVVPRGYVAAFTLTVDYSGGQTVSTFQLPVGQLDYFVWDPTPDRSSGPGIHEALRMSAYTGGWMLNLPMAELEKYATLWISAGVFASNYVIPSNSPEALAITDYLNAGGCVYLEGADLWAYDPGIGGHNFGPAFGISGQVDGSGDLLQVQGVSGTFTEGVAMYYGGENAYIDHLGAVGTGFPILKNSSPFYYCGIANDTGVYRTVGTSFEFAHLGDDTPPSTRSALAGAIMEFFLPVDPAGVPGPQGPAAAAHIAFQGSNLLAGGSAARSGLVLRIAREAGVRVELLDVTGRRVQTLLAGRRAPGDHALDRIAPGIGSGVYFLRASSEGTRVSRRVLVTR